MLHQLPAVTGLKRFARNPAGRDFAVGDIHGQFARLEQAMAHIGFDRSRDRLFCLGDLVDRGPESLDALTWLGHPWFHSVQGNHEMLAWAAHVGEAMDVRLHVINGGQWFQGVPVPERTHIIEVLSGLPMAMEIDTAQGVIGLVHADLAGGDWRRFSRALEYGTLSPLDMRYAQWSRERISRHDTTRVANARAIVHGHTTTPEMVRLGNVYFVDTFNGDLPEGEQGRFTFLELDTLTEHVGPGRPWVIR